jgi:hypothetical protein
LLQRRQAVATLFQASLPPCDSGVMWSRVEQRTVVQWRDVLIAHEGQALAGAARGNN